MKKTSTDLKKKFNTNKIQGVDIINITQSKQLNLFIMKNLYDLWAINFKKNKIKYFNYDSTEVINATENMMNTLSNNISIEHNDFKILFEKAFQNLMQLAAQYLPHQHNMVIYIYIYIYRA